MNEICPTKTDPCVPVECAPEPVIETDPCASVVEAPAPVVEYVSTGFQFSYATYGFTLFICAIVIMMVTFMVCATIGYSRDAKKRKKK